MRSEAHGSRLRQGAPLSLRDQDGPQPVRPVRHERLRRRVDLDKERLLARSPLVHASNIRRPLLVVQGANDPRVIQEESDEMVAAVRANGVPVEYVLFPDEGHGFRRKENRITASQAYVKFLEEHLRP